MGAWLNFISLLSSTLSPKKADDLKVGWYVLARLLRGDELQLVQGAEKRGVERERVRETTLWLVRPARRRNRRVLFILTCP